MACLHRIDSFVGSDNDYILFLESQVRNLRRRLTHQTGEDRDVSCGPTTPSPANTASTGTNASQASLHSHQPRQFEARGLSQPASTPATVAPEKHRNFNTLEIIPFSFEGNSVGRTRSRSKVTADWELRTMELLKATPNADHWESTMKAVGIFDTIHSGQAVAYFLGDTHIDTWTTENRGPQHKRTRHQHTALLERVTSYASFARRNEVNAAVAGMLANFQKFLLLSVCVVIQATGQAQDSEVMSILKTLLGNVSDQYCRRQLGVAKYMNQLIDVLSANGWENRAAELLMSCKLFTALPGADTNLMSAQGIAVQPIIILFRGLQRSVWSIYETACHKRHIR